LVDEQIDGIYGLYDNVIELPKVVIIDSDKYKYINLKKSKIEYVGAPRSDEILICQHFIDIYKILSEKSNNIDRYQRNINNFMNTFIFENEEHKYVCKSCGEYVDMGNWILDGSYNNDGFFVSLSSMIYIPLEEITQYVYKKNTIQYLDKLSEKITGILNFQYFIGISGAIKNRKKNLIKDTIDLMEIHNKNLKGIFQSRIETLMVKYGINNEFTSLFVFDLELINCVR